MLLIFFMKKSMTSPYQNTYTYKSLGYLRMIPACVLETVFLELFIPDSQLPHISHNPILPLCRWDFCFHKGSVIEHIDGHTDIVHKLLYHHWLPWSDLCLFFVLIEHLFISLQDINVA